MSKLSLKALLVSVSLGVATVNIPMQALAFQPGTITTEQAAALANNLQFQALVSSIVPGATVAVGGIGGFTAATVAGALAAALGALVVISGGNNNNEFFATGTTGTTATGTR